MRYQSARAHGASVRQKLHILGQSRIAGAPSSRRPFVAPVDQDAIDSCPQFCRLAVANPEEGLLKVGTCERIAAGLYYLALSQ